ncbi:MAG TPA: sulfite exporter TauE/SafE family protein [Quisquiliibacterium sp.]|nr:sulfite exporter TauE/SafE family protein [Quisquiliibacterium sp.]HPA88930.1 sulfite exporter TauE/SafE family protein [Quisquiliibacterium sp.]HQN12414.1 sulfite exporter TauE/SafE family protein [Quisquiliibacterium sp.]HQP66959.1 sulfite exporter TauE/SafE family protein [Quisquiliibacterium sp.]
MTWILAYAAAGAFVGFLAGLLGIGGGMTLVPVLSALYSAQALASDHIVHMALATAMASVMFTSSSSVFAHHRMGAVDWSVFRRMSPGMVVGALGSTLASGWLPQRVLALSFAVIVYAGATQMLLNRKPAPGRTLPGPGPMFGIGLAIGMICGLVSAGGAFLTVPFMLFCGVSMHRAIGTGAAVGIPVAVVGTVGYVVAGLSAPGLPDYTLGFVYLPALAVVVAVSVLLAPVGARLAHRMPVLTLKRVFALLLFLLATKMAVTYW